MSDVTIRFFASLRETLSCEQLSVNIEESVALEDLIAQIVSQQTTQSDAGPSEEAWLQALKDPDVLIAINQTMMTRGCTVAPGDEVAFLPPVTGG